MKYSVQWTGRALAALAQVWLDNPALRAAINQAVATIDELLQVDPQVQGESRDADRRIVFVPPLVVIFRVNTARGTVRVLNMRLIKRRGGH